MFYGRGTPEVALRLALVSRRLPSREMGCQGAGVSTQGYLAHKKTAIPLGPPYGLGHEPTVGSQKREYFYERGIPVRPRQALRPPGNKWMFLARSVGHMLRKGNPLLCSLRDIVLHMSSYRPCVCCTAKNVYTLSQKRDGIAHSVDPAPTLLLHPSATAPERLVHIPNTAHRPNIPKTGHRSKCLR